MSKLSHLRILPRSSTSAGSGTQRVVDFDNRVAVVEPGAVRTAIWEKGRATTERLERELPAEAFERYAKGMQSIRDGIAESETKGVGADKVADAVTHALFAKRPKHRYLVGPDAKVAGTLSRLLPDRAKHAVMARFAGP